MDRVGTCLREGKSAISGAGPSTGPMLRSASPALIHQEHAAWVTAVELARAVARAAAAIATPARKGRRAGQPVHAKPRDRGRGMGHMTLWCGTCSDQDHRSLTPSWTPKFQRPADSVRTEGARRDAPPAQRPKKGYTS